MAKAHTYQKICVVVVVVFVVVVVVVVGQGFSSLRGTKFHVVSRRTTK